MVRLADSHVYENQTEPDPMSWDDFAAEHPGRAANIDVDFFADDRPTDAIEAFTEISNRLRNGDVAGARDVADLWRATAQGFRDWKMEDYLGSSWPRPAA